MGNYPYSALTKEYLVVGTEFLRDNLWVNNSSSEAGLERWDEITDGVVVVHACFFLELLETRLCLTRHLPTILDWIAGTSDSDWIVYQPFHLASHVAR